LELNAVAYTFSKIFQPEERTTYGTQFLWRLKTTFLHQFSLRGDLGNKEKALSAVEDFSSFWWYSGTQQIIGRAKQKQT